jgi:hypothetical protein
MHGKGNHLQSKGTIYAWNGEPSAEGENHMHGMENHRQGEGTICMERGPCSEGEGTISREK